MKLGLTLVVLQLIWETKLLNYNDQMRPKLTLAESYVSFLNYQNNKDTTDPN